MCNYCRKLTQKAYRLKEGYDVTINYPGDVFIDFFNNLIVHLEGPDSIEVSLPIKYCPWCGKELENVRTNSARKLFHLESQAY